MQLNEFDDVYCTPPIGVHKDAHTHAKWENNGPHWKLWMWAGACLLKK